MKKKKIGLILFPILFLLLIGILSFATAKTGKMQPNPAGTVGNTAGNLNNGGFFCEQNGTVFFANVSVGGNLYAMNPDESNMRQINTMNVRNILADDYRVYFFQLGASVENNSGFTNMLSAKSLIRCDHEGKHTASLTQETVLNAQLVDNSLYLLLGGKTVSFQKMNLDKADIVTLADYEINPSSVYNGVIYYNGTQVNHALYALNTVNHSVSQVLDAKLWYPVVMNGYVYYLDVSNQYRLCRYSLSQGWIEVLTQDRVDCYNVDNNYIYYQRNDKTPALVCMRTDGSSPFVVAEGIFTNINMTSQYVYCQEINNDRLFYHSLLGSNQFEPFHVK